MQISLGSLAEQKHYSDSNAPLVVTAAAKALSVGDTRILTDATDNVVALTLPPVGEAAGRIYSVTVLEASNNTTIDDGGDDPYFTINTYNGVGETGKFYSDGTTWARFTESVA